jgi:hypothetical protein
MVLMARMLQYLSYQRAMQVLFSLRLARLILDRRLHKVPLFLLILVFLDPQDVFSLGPPMDLVRESKRRGHDDMVQDNQRGQMHRLDRVCERSRVGE